MMFISGCVQSFRNVRLGSRYPLRLLDIYMYYEEHCKEKNTFLQSKDYVSKLIIRLFPGAKRNLVCRNSQKYAAYEGLWRCAINDRTIRDQATVVTDGTFFMLTVYKINERQVNIATSLNDNKMYVEVGDERRPVDLSSINFGPMLTTVRS